MGKKLTRIKPVGGVGVGRLWVWCALIITGLIVILAVNLSKTPDTSEVKPVLKLADNSRAKAVLNKVLPVNSASKSATISAFKNKKTKPVIPANYGRTVHVPILTYHYVRVVTNQADKAGLNLSVAPDKFDAQMGYLVSQGFNTITFDTLYAGLKGQATLPSKPIILTFDDGYIDFYTTVYPILKKYNLHAVSFIPVGLIDHSYYMSWSQIKEIDSSGLVSFQAHSVSHPNLANMDPVSVKFQVTESKKVLESQLGKVVNTFAYPYGASNESTWNFVKAAGFVGGVGTWFGTIESEGTIYDMPRVKIAGSVELPTYAKLVAN